MLDVGYSDGQLDASEYRSRTDVAMTAKTLADLDALTEDLQIPDRLLGDVPPPPRRPIPARFAAAVVAAVTAVTVVVAVVTLVVVGTRDDGDPTPPAETVAAPAPVQPARPEGEPAPIVIEPIDTATADGFAEFRRQFHDKFGDGIVDDLYLAQSHGTFTRMLPEQPHRAQRWDYYRGFEPSGPPTSRTSDSTVDLAEIEIDRFRDLIAEAPMRVGLPAGRIDYIIVRPDPITADPEIGIYVKDPSTRTGYLFATFDGRVTFVSTPSAGGN